MWSNSFLNICMLAPIGQCCSPPRPEKVLSVVDVNAEIHNWSKSWDRTWWVLSPKWTFPPAPNPSLRDHPCRRGRRNVGAGGWRGALWMPPSGHAMATVLRLTAAAVSRTRSRRKLSPQLSKLLPSLGYNNRMWRTCRWWEKCQGVLGESGETEAYGLDIAYVCMDSKE